MARNSDPCPSPYARPTRAHTHLRAQKRASVILGRKCAYPCPGTEYAEAHALTLSRNAYCMPLAHLALSLSLTRVHTPTCACIMRACEHTGGKRRRSKKRARGDMRTHASPELLYIPAPCPGSRRPRLLPPTPLRCRPPPARERPQNRALPRKAAGAGRALSLCRSPID